MVRPCFLIIDHEHAGSISTRKLVVETAKFNVLTAYSGEEAFAMLQKFPAIDGIIMDAIYDGISSRDLVRRFKEHCPDVPIIVISMHGAASCPEADHELESFEPVSLLALLRRLEPRRADEILAHDNELRRHEKA